MWQVDNASVLGESKSLAARSRRSYDNDSNTANDDPDFDNILRSQGTEVEL